MIHLSNHPAFGFETNHCNADQFEIKRRDNLHEIWHQACTPNEPKDPRLEKSLSTMRRISVKQDRFMTNLLKALAYFPIAGMAIGIRNLVHCIQASSEKIPNKKNHIFRHIIETSNLGFLLIVPDLIITVARHENILCAK